MEQKNGVTQQNHNNGSNQNNGNHNGGNNRHRYNKRYGYNKNRGNHENRENKEDKQKEFYKMINLQRFRSFVMKKNTRREAIELIKNKEVKLIDAIRYFIHLGYRKIFKVSCGFKL